MTTVRSEPKGVSKPAIYTFLGLATLPRFRGRCVDGPRTRGARPAANPLRLLPREIVTHIARFAYRAGYHAHWVEFSTVDEVAVAVDVSDTWSRAWSRESIRLAHMVSSKTYYVEVRFTHAWWGSGLEILGVGSQRFRCVLNNNGGSASRVGETGQIACFSSHDSGPLSMSSLGVDSWSYKAPVTMSILVDLVRGCATFGLNGLAGPCVRFPAGGTWRRGVQVDAWGFPPGSVLNGGRCVVACATLPTPPSMLAAASHPMTVAEHLAAGSLRREEANPIVPWI
jgi:hypothetical protein